MTGIRLEVESDRRRTSKNSKVVNNICQMGKLVVQSSVRSNTIVPWTDEFFTPVIDCWSIIS